MVCESGRAGVGVVDGAGLKGSELDEVGIGDGVDGPFDFDAFV